MKLSRLAELDLIAAIRREFGGEGGSVTVGIGDDAAVIRAGRDTLLLTTDLLVEGTHFLRPIQAPFYLGRKSLNVNISDIAAMGGRPRFALLGLGLPPRTPKAWVEAFFAGLKRAAKEFRVHLIGGDLSRSDKILISLTLIGQAQRYVRRSGGRPGQALFISGYPGRAGAGLALLRSGVRFGYDRGADLMIRAFLDPVPQVELGSALARLGAASAMIDTSDGLSVDVRNLCRESRVGAEIDIERIPIAPELARYRRSPLDDALYGGEDYGLLFAVPRSKLAAVERLAKRSNLTQIGRLTRGSEVVLVLPSGRRTSLMPRGYRHFK
jgi:thiamine-monophosphate kinase